MTDSNLMPIGQFARSCRLSVKALRHYADIGLLEPAYVDPQSRYRYYQQDQARTAVMIGMLRSIDMPLPVIREALDATPANLKTLIDAETRRIEAELAVRRQTLLSLQHLAKSGELAPYQIAVEEIPEYRVARSAGTTTSQLLIEDTTALLNRLTQELHRCGVSAHGPVFVLNDFAEGEDRIVIEACIGIDQVTGTDMETEKMKLDLPRAEVVFLPGGSFACLTHVGPYETLGLAHHALFAWAQSWGHSLHGPVWEFYANDPAEVPAEELVTKVALPLKRNP